MNSIVYIGSRSKIGFRFQTVIESVLPTEKMILLRTPAELHDTLLTSQSYSKLVILLAASRAELARFIEMRPLLLNQKLILILPDDRRDTFLKGFSLYPRFVSDINSSLTEIAAVLKKMYLRY